MRFQIGDMHISTTSAPDHKRFKRIAGPSSPLVHLFAWFIGIAMLMVLLVLIIGSGLAASQPTGSIRADEPAPWAAIVVTFVLVVPAHELLHALFYPDAGLSSSTIFFVWPRKLRFGVYFEGSMSRRRWLIMRLAPLIILSTLPTLLLVSPAGISLNFTLQTCLSLLLLANSLGSGGDVLAAVWVLSHVPKGATMTFIEGKAYLELG